MFLEDPAPHTVHDHVLSKAEDDARRSHTAVRESIVVQAGLTRWHGHAREPISIRACLVASIAASAAFLIIINFGMTRGPKPSTARASWSRTTTLAPLRGRNTDASVDPLVQLGDLPIRLAIAPCTRLRKLGPCRANFRGQQASFARPSAAPGMRQIVHIAISFKPQGCCQPCRPQVPGPLPRNDDSLRAPDRLGCAHRRTAHRSRLLVISLHLNSVAIVVPALVGLYEAWLGVGKRDRIENAQQ